jgi:hypothetical protein
MVKRHFYYHVTQKKWPKRITLSPRKIGEHRAIDEPEINRICVSPSIEECIIALGSCLKYYSNINIYRTVSKVYAYNSYDIPDSHITQEKWLINPTRFMKIGAVNYLIPESIFDLSVGNSSGFEKQIENLKKLQNMKLKFVTWLK